VVFPPPNKYRKAQVTVYGNQISGEFERGSDPGPNPGNSAAATNEQRLDNT